MLRRIFELQWLHLLGLASLLLAVRFATDFETVRAGELGGVSSEAWLWISVWTAVAHQVLVWFCWRTQLHASLLTRILGDRGFTLYAIAFSVIGIGRVVVVFLTALSNQGTVAIAPVAQKVVAVLLALPAFYLFYSVRRYFGFRRAFGIDHFDPAYRSAPMVRKGIFRFTRNGMYVFGFFILWVPGFWWDSAAALCAAAFNHAYIWVHFHTTEAPDMRHIYGGMDREASRRTPGPGSDNGRRRAGGTG